MFKPLRFNKLLKAVPGLSHLVHTPHSTAHVHIAKTVEIQKTREVASASKGKKEIHAHETITEDITVKTNKTVKHAHVQEDIDVKAVKTDGMTDTLAHVHATRIGVAQIEMTPPHLPREETPIYSRTHNHLVNKLDTPCAVCGVRKSTLDDPKENPFGATAIETHHYPLERSLLDACDPKKVSVIFPQVKDRDSLEEFIDSEENMMVLCDVHHRHPLYGIHHLVAPDFFVQSFLYGGYQVATDEEHVEQVRIANEKIVNKHHAFTMKVEEKVTEDVVIRKKHS